MTSNPTLAHVASRNPDDVYGIIQMAETESKDPVDLEGSYSLDELGEFVDVMNSLPSFRAFFTSERRDPCIEPLTSQRNTAVMGRPASFFSFQSRCDWTTISPAGIAN